MLMCHFHLNLGGGCFASSLRVMDWVRQRQEALAIAGQSGVEEEVPFPKTDE